MFRQSFLYFSLILVSIIDRLILLSQKFFQIRSLIYQSFLSSFQYKHAQLVFSMLFGEIDSFDFDLQKQFKIIGLLHVISASGFNISLLSGVYQRFTRGKIARKIRALGQGVLVVVYCILAENSASVWRAGMMLLISLISRCFFYFSSRTEFNLVYAGTILVLIRPALLESLSFQLSFLATAGLIWLAPCFSQDSQLLDLQTSAAIISVADQKKNHKFSWQSVGQSLLAYMKDSLVISIIAQAAIWPLIANVFQKFSLLSLVANPLLLWLTPVITIGGLYWLLISCLVNALHLSEIAQVLAWPLDLMVAFFLRLVAWLAQYDQAVIDLKSFSLSLSYLWWGGLFAYGWWWRAKRTYQAKKQLKSGWQQLFF